MNSIRRLVIPAIGLGVGILILYGILAGEGSVLARFVVPESGEVADWVFYYKAQQVKWVLHPVYGLAIVWIVSSSVHPGIRGDLRWLWYVLLAISLVLAIRAVLFHLPEEPGNWPKVFTLFNGGMAFWTCTVAGTVSTHKFAPIGSLTLRKSW